MGLEPPDELSNSWLFDAANIKEIHFPINWFCKWKEDYYETH